MLEAYRRHLVSECIMLDDLCRAEPRDPYVCAEDLLLNAERRAAQGRYDDAVARIYRAIELIAQVRLETKHGIKTGDVDDVDLQKVPESMRHALERYRADKGKIHIPLFQVWSLLQELKDKPLGGWFDKNRSKVQDFLGTRNLSILAHGQKPIDAATYQKVGLPGLALSREALASIPEAERRKSNVPQLPDRLKCLEAD